MVLRDTQKATGQYFAKRAEVRMKKAHDNATPVMKRDGRRNS